MITTMDLQGLYTKEAGRQRGEDGIGSLGLADETGIYGMNKQKILLYSVGNYIQHPVINLNEKEYVCITESLCYTAEINTTL